MRHLRQGPVSPVLNIHRPKLIEKFVMLPNDLLFDDRLSALARCIVAELMARPPGWQTTADRMCDAAIRARGSKAESRRAFHAAFAELEEHGYLLRRRTRIPKGEPNGGNFITILDLYALPQTGTSWGSSGDDLISEPFTDESFTAAGSSVSTDTQNGSSTRLGQHAAEFAGAHSGQQAGSDLPDRLQRLYDRADQLTDEQLRRLLLAFEDNRKTVYAKARNDALKQLKKSNPRITKEPDGYRKIDLLSFKYGLQHYGSDPDKDLPAWLTTLPKPRQAA